MKKSSLLALSLVSMVSLVACGNSKPDPKKVMEDAVTAYFGAEYVEGIEVDKSQGYDDYWLALIFVPNDGEEFTYVELCEDAFAELKPVLEKANLSVYQEVISDEDYEQAFFEFAWMDNEDEAKVNQVVCFDCLCYAYDYNGADAVVCQFEAYEITIN